MKNSQNVYLVLKISQPTEQSQLIAKATALRRKSNDKKEEIRELEEQIKVLEMKRKKV